MKSNFSNKIKNFLKICRKTEVEINPEIQKIIERIKEEKRTRDDSLIDHSTFKEFINFASERVESYDRQRRFLLQISLSLLIFSITLFTFIVDFVNRPENLDSFVFFEYIIYGSTLLFVFSFLSVYIYMFEWRTDTGHSSLMKNLWFYRGYESIPKKHRVRNIEANFEEFFNKIKYIKKEDLWIDDLKELFILFRYQVRRYNLAKTTAISIFGGVTFFVAFGLSQIIVNLFRIVIPQCLKIYFIILLLITVSLILILVGREYLKT